MTGMAIDASGTSSHNARVKLAFQLAVHVPFWALVLMLTAILGKTREVQAGDTSEQLALLVGLAVIGFGLIAAGFGACAGFLDDSEEARDLRRERRALLLGACALVASGSSLILLSLAGPGRLLPAAVGVTGALALNVIAIIFVAVRWQRLDELNRGAARESGYLAFTWLAWFGGTWAIFAHLDYVAAPAPLDWLTMINGFSFIGGIVAVARKGGFTS
jgi:hypothetical protein